MINTSKIKESMPLLNLNERVESFKEVELGFEKENAIKEASRCLNCKSRPCVGGCPVNVDIPKFIHSIVCEDFSSAYKTILKNNAFPAICGRVCPQEKQCEAKCVRAKSGESVAIGRLERFAADECAKHQIADVNISDSDSFEHCTGKDTYNVAVIGAGPSGLMCASELASLGVKVTVFEALHTAGGVLAYGIPEFRLPKNILKGEIENLKIRGVKIVTNAVVGKSFSVDNLFTQGFEAVYISSGAGLPKFMNIPGEGFSGVYSANEFLTRINLMKAHCEDYDTPMIKPHHVVVVGGGNVAMDAARCARRLNANKVTVIYRRTENEMPARRDEILHAKEEGIEFLFLSNPVEFIGESSKVTGVRYITMKLGEKDSSGRSSVVPVSEKTFEIPADTVIVAVGNNSNTLIRSSDSTINCDFKGRIVVNPETTQTSRPFVYAGGDVVTGAATVILAMGAGKKAAHQIVCDLKNKKTNK